MGYDTVCTTCIQARCPVEYKNNLESGTDKDGSILGLQDKTSLHASTTGAYGRKGKEQVIVELGPIREGKKREEERGPAVVTCREWEKWEDRGAGGQKIGIYRYTGATTKEV